MTTSCANGERVQTLNCTVYVQGVCSECPIEVLKQMFQHIGVISDCKLFKNEITSNQSTFVITFTQPEAASTALSLNSIELLGSRLTVLSEYEFKETQTNTVLCRQNANTNLSHLCFSGSNHQTINEVQRTVYVGNIQHTSTAETLKLFLEDQFGNVDSCVVLQSELYSPEITQYFSFVQFSSFESSRRALKKNGIQFKGLPLRILDTNHYSVVHYRTEYRKYLTTKAKADNILEKLNRKLQDNISDRTHCLGEKKPKESFDEKQKQKQTRKCGKVENEGNHRKRLKM